MMKLIEYPFYLITDKPFDNQKKFLELLELSLNSGVKLVQIRAKSLDEQAYRKLAMAAVKLCHQYHAKALLSQYINLVNEIGADGVHLPSSKLMQLIDRPVTAEYLLSVACHDAAQLRHAAHIQADFAVISPIFSTPSSPMGNPLGWEKFSALAAEATMPVYALGGMTPNQLEVARSYGAVGIAAIRSLWGVGF